MAAPAAVPGLNFGPEVTYILAAVLIITGLALAFWGHGLWATVMSMIGALLGSAVGFLFGAALGGLIPGLILALVGAVIGSILFTKLVKVAFAFPVRRLRPRHRPRREVETQTCGARPWTTSLIHRVIFRYASRPFSVKPTRTWPSAPSSSEMRPCSRIQSR